MDKVTSYNSEVYRGKDLGCIDADPDHPFAQEEENTSPARNFGAEATRLVQTLYEQIRRRRG